MNSNPQFNYKLIDVVEDLLKINIKNVEMPIQGMDNQIFFITDNHKKEYVIKYGKNVLADKKAFELLKRNSIDVKVPEVIKTFMLANKHGLILEKINDPLLESIEISEMHKYIPSMIDNLKKIHTVKANRAGFILNEESSLSWKDFLLSFFNDEDYLNWQSIIERKTLNKELIENSIKNVIEKINNQEFINNSYSLLHSDFNQRNLFINTETNEITAIIDWTESMFGDPLYDFARIRMLIWHFDLGQEVIDYFDSQLNLSDKQKELLELYWLVRVIEYLAYYSEEPNEFNTNRIKLHQEFLQNYIWSAK